MFRQILGKVVFIPQTSITLLTFLSVRDISRLTDCNSEDQVVDQFSSCLSKIALLQLFFFPGVSTSHATSGPAVKGMYFSSTHVEGVEGGEDDDDGHLH